MQQVQWKLMTKFLFKFKQRYFWTIFDSFPQFWTQKIFFQKLQLCHAQLHKGF